MKIKIILLLAIATAKAAVLPSSPEIVKIPDDKIITPELTGITKATSATAADSILAQPTLDKTADTSIPAQPASKVMARASVTEITVKTTATPIAPPFDIKIDSAIKKSEKELAKKVIAEKVSPKEVSGSTSKDTIPDKQSSFKSVDGPTAFSFVHDAPLILHEYDDLGDFDEVNFGDDKNYESIGHNYFGY